MATSNAVRFLAKGGVDDELALEMFYGVVLENFHANTLLWNAADGASGVGADQVPSEFVASKTIESGKSWQFVLVGDDGDPETHTPGTELLGQNYTFDEGNVTIDGILVKHYDVPFDQLQMAHWPVIEQLGRKLGRALATNFDQRLFSIAGQAALASSASKDGITLHNGGNFVERVDGSGVSSAYPVSATGAKNFRDDVEHLAQLLDEDNAPEAGRHLVITPYIRRVLMQDTAIFDERFNIEMTNSLNTRNIGTMAGFVVHKSNHIPDTNLTGTSLGGNLPAKYQHDWTYDGGDDGQPVALAFCGADEGEAPIGYVAGSMPELGPIFTFMEQDQRRNTTFMKGQMMVGADQLDVKCAGAVIVDDA